MLIDGRHRVEVGSSAINQTVFIRWTGNMGSNSYVWSPRRGPAVHVIADDGSFGGRWGRLPRESDAVPLGFPLRQLTNPEIKRATITNSSFAGLVVTHGLVPRALFDWTTFQSFHKRGRFACGFAKA